MSYRNPNYNNSYEEYAAVMRGEHVPASEGRGAQNAQINQPRQATPIQTQPQTPTQNVPSTAPQAQNDALAARADLQEQLNRAEQRRAATLELLKNPPVGMPAQAVQSQYASLASAEANIETLQNALNYIDQTGSAPPAVTVGSFASDTLRGIPVGLSPVSPEVLVAL
jgi:hypothetical protein